MSKSIYRKVGLASLIMMASVFLSRVIGLLREMVIAYVGGAGAARIHVPRGVSRALLADRQAPRTLEMVNRAGVF